MISFLIQYLTAQQLDLTVRFPNILKGELAAFSSPVYENIDNEVLAGELHFYTPKATL